MSDHGLEGLSPADELELRRRRGAEAQAARKARFNALIRAEYRRQKGTPERAAGRPGWTADLFAQRLAEAEAATSEPRTWERRAANFRALDGTLAGVSGDHLRKLAMRFGGKNTG